MRHLAGAAAALLIAGPAFAEAHAPGDAAAGEKAFRQCASCHMVQNEAGDVVAGGKARTGPNLYGVALRPYGAVEGFGYSDAMAQAGEAGHVWTGPAFAAFVQDPTGHLREVTGDGGARSKMTFRLRKAEAAPDLWAFLLSVGPELTPEQVEELAAAEAEGS